MGAVNLGAAHYQLSELGLFKSYELQCLLP